MELPLLPALCGLETLGLVDGDFFFETGELVCSGKKTIGTYVSII